MAAKNKKIRTHEASMLKATGDVLVACAAEKSILFDFYGSLLGDRHREIFVFYYEDNLSLSEIATELVISRQAAHEALKKADRILKDAEEKLGLVARHEAWLSALYEVDSDTDKLVKDISELDIEKKDMDRIKRRIKKISKTINEMDV